MCVQVRDMFLLSFHHVVPGIKLRPLALVAGVLPAGLFHWSLYSSFFSIWKSEWHPYLVFGKQSIMASLHTTSRTKLLYMKLKSALADFMNLCELFNFFKKIFLFLFYVCRCLTCIYICAPCVPGACGGQKRVLDPLALEIGTVARNHGSRRNRTWDLSKRNCWTISPALADSLVNHELKPRSQPWDIGDLPLGLALYQVTSLLST